MRNRGEESRPLYWQVADDIVAKIEARQLRPGDKLPSERELCDVYDVSQITVRRALRELAHLDRVYSRHGVGWFVSEGVDEGKSVAMVVAAPTLDRLTMPLIRSLARKLAQERISLHLIFLPDGVQEGADLLAQAQAHGTDAFLLTVAGDERNLMGRYGQLLDELESPALFLLRQIEGLDVPAIIVDEEAGVRELTQHVLGLGHEHLAYAGGNPSRIEGWLPYHGFAQSLWERGLDFPLEWAFSWPLTSEEGRDQFENVFGGLDHPSALVCASARRAAEALRALREMRLRCPQDVAVVGLGDRDFAPLLSPGLTTFRFDWQGLGEATASVIDDILSGHTVSSITIAGDLIVRDSCGANRSGSF